MSSDGFPRPKQGVVVDGTTAATLYEKTEHSAIHPFNAEARIFREEELRRKADINFDDFLGGESAIDNEPRFIRKAFVESICAHERGTIIRTYSGDFHLFRDKPGHFHSQFRGCRYQNSWGQDTELELLKTAVRELEQRCERLEEKEG